MQLLKGLLQEQQLKDSLFLMKMLWERFQLKLLKQGLGILLVC